MNFTEAMRRMRRLRAQISPHDSAERFSKLGIDVYFGQGSFKNDHEIEVDGQTLEFSRAVIATGGRAAAPPIPGLADVEYLTNETIFSLTELPRRLIVVGTGPIGSEMAQTFRRFGSEVHAIDRSDRILGKEDVDAAKQQKEIAALRCLN